MNTSIDLGELFADRKLDLPDKKNVLRKLIIAERNAMPNETREFLSNNLCELALMLEEAADAQTVALFASRPHEPRTDLLLNIYSQRKKTVLLPMLSDGMRRDWAKFISLDDLTERLPGRPLEPTSPNLGPEACKDADLILVPAVAIDTRGNRLGHGGGWYDRVLAERRPDVKAFALVFDSEVFDADVCELPHEAHDIRIDGYITPTEIVRLS